MDGDTPVDVIDAACTACGERVEFAFDISSFYGRMKEQQELEEALSGLPERTRKKFVRRLGPPMSRTLSFIQQLVNDRDDAALDYLQESIELARREARGAAEGS